MCATSPQFQHTYTVSIATDASSYVPGPGPRTAQYEEENTYSNVLSTEHPWLNLLSLNFGCVMRGAVTDCMPDATWQC